MAAQSERKTGLDRKNPAAPWNHASCCKALKKCIPTDLLPALPTPQKSASEKQRWQEGQNVYRPPLLSLVLLKKNLNRNPTWSGLSCSLWQSRSAPLLGRMSSRLPPSGQLSHLFGCHGTGSLPGCTFSRVCTPEEGRGWSSRWGFGQSSCCATSHLGKVRGIINKRLEGVTLLGGVTT